MARGRLGVVAPVLLVLLVVVPGCGRKAQTPIPDLSLRDDASIITSAMRSELAGLGKRLASRGVHLAVLTVPKIASREPAEYGDRAYDSYPTYDAVIPQPGAKRSKSEKAESEAWQPAGLLIVASTQPRLVQVRLGASLRPILPDSVLHPLLEDHVYGPIMAGDLRHGLMEGARALAQVIEVSQVQPAGSGRLRGMVAQGMALLHDYGFPSWRPYYWLLFDPLLNTLAVLLKLGGGRAWLLLPWLLGLYLLARKDFAGQGLQRMNLWLIRILSPLWGRWARTTRAQVQVADGAATVARVESRVLQYGMGLPAFAVLSLLIVPYWENVMTVRAHLYPCFRDWDVHALFCLRGGLLWWSSATAPAGTLAAIVLGVAVVAGSAADTALTMWIGSLSYDEANRAGISAAHWGVCKGLVEAAKHTPGLLFGGVWQGVLMGLAAAFVPLVLVLYYLLGAAESAVSSMQQFISWAPRIRRATHPARLSPGTEAATGAFPPTGEIGHRPSNPGPLQVHQQGAERALASGNLGEALDHANWLVRHYPVLAIYHYLRAIALVGLQRWPECDRELRYVLRFGPVLTDDSGRSFGDPLRELAMVRSSWSLQLLAAGRLAQAHRLAASASHYAPDCAAPKIARGACLMAMGRAEQGLLLIRQGIEQEPDDPFAAGFREVLRQNGVAV